MISLAELRALRDDQKARCAFLRRRPSSEIPGAARENATARQRASTAAADVLVDGTPVTEHPEAAVLVREIHDLGAEITTLLRKGAA